MENEFECYEEEVQPYRNTDHKLIIYIMMADKHNIPKGKMHSNCRVLPNHIVCKITHRNNIKRANTCDPAFKLLNEKITSYIHKHIEGASRRTMGSHAQHTHSLEDHTWCIQQSTSNHTKQLNNIQQYKKQSKFDVLICSLNVYHSHGAA